MKICAHCNNANDDQSQYCAFCGSQLSEIAVAQPVQNYSTDQYSQIPGSQAFAVQQSASQQAYTNPVPTDYSQPSAQGQMQQAPVDYSQPLSSAYGQPYTQGSYQQARPGYAQFQPQVQTSSQQTPVDYAQTAPIAPRPNYAVPNGAAAQKSKTVAGVLALFLGNLGAQRFYLGNTKAGIINLVLFLLVLPIPVLTIISLIEGIKFLTMSQDKFEQEYVIEHKAWL